MQKETRDKRVQRTRQALLGAFFGLVLERRYDEIKVADILERAGVGKSTFYEHFSSKDAILASSLTGPFEVLADSTRRPDNTAQLIALLEHFWRTVRWPEAYFKEQRGARRRRYWLV